MNHTNYTDYHREKLKEIKEMERNVKYIRSNAIENIFSYTDDNGEEEFIKFPKSMDMKILDVQDYLNKI